jgi:hypothetical protein
MKKVLVLAASSAMFATFGFLPSAQATTHGCISVAGAANISADTANGNVSGPCSFVVVDGDSYSGVGPFTLVCGSQNDSVASGATAVLVPITCAAGSTATLDATAGGVAAAGNVQ